MEKCTFAFERRTVKGGERETARWTDLKSTTHRSDSEVCVCVCVCVCPRVYVPAIVILYCVSALDYALCSYVCLLCVLVHACCSGGLTVCNQAWCESSPTHSAFIRLTEGETVKGEKGVCLCVCACVLALVCELMYVCGCNFGEKSSILVLLSCCPCSYVF